ncbi:uncharacterized protein LODBEIA_P30140 [Lodderomyces beijingensis]|uniref:Zn(2)-C6 fungal-type domain-containing protein n=1 Tax=Lodderomyces beijingensis TaxID=1775926 RepID=A0ABP0ZRG9_9ASCO
MAKPKPTQRRRHTNSKLGCLNCKKKKIRCDERLPSCQNCLKGKGDTCSYLSLSNNDIEKLKLTHSLRNSQNKLLQRSFRLPATSSSQVPKSSHMKLFSPVHDYFATSKNDDGGSVLEFKFELANLPIWIPRIHYPPLQYNNLSMQDFTGEFKVMNDDILSDADSEEQMASTGVLPQGFDYKMTFKRINRSAFVKVDKRVTMVPRIVTDFSHYIVRGENVLLDYMSDLTLKKYHDPVLTCGFQCLGEIIILNSHRQYPQRTQDSFLNSLDTRALELFSSGQKALDQEMKRISRHSDQYPFEKVGEDIELVAYASHLFTFSLLMMGGGMQAFFNAQKYAMLGFEVYTKLIEQNPSNMRPIINFLQSNLQHNLISINIPSYYPQFLFEIESNLSSLEFIYTDSASFTNVEEINQSLSTLQAQSHSLLKFLRDKVLPILFTMRNEDFITTYPPNVIFEILREWHSICPSQAMAYNPRIDNHHYDESVFLKDISTPLYTYFFAIAASLDAIFPACKYLFSLTFILPTAGKLNEKDTLTVCKYNRYTQEFFSQRIDEMLQRHICYASRLFAFFKRRFIFYNNYLQWSNYYDRVELVQNRFQARKVVNVKETAIQSFNTTLIRPEHYPTRDKSVGQDVMSYVSFNREDDSVVKNLYARNIETLNIFNESMLLQYDYETMLLLKDYRPLDDCDEFTRALLSFKDIRDYFEDKVKIINYLSDT